MKRIFFTLTLCLGILTTMAADMPKQGFGFQIGYAQPTLRLNSDNILYPKDSLVNITQLHGLKVGVVYDCSYWKGLGSSIGINYTFAAKTTGWQPATSFTRYPEYRHSYMYHQVEAFVDWQYKFEIAKETYLMLYTGPTIQCGIALYDKKETREDITGLNLHAESTRNRYTDDDPNYILRRVNVTWGVGAGFVSLANTNATSSAADTTSVSSTHTRTITTPTLLPEKEWIDIPVVVLTNGKLKLEHTSYINDSTRDD